LNVPLARDLTSTTRRDDRGESAAIAAQDAATVEALFDDQERQQAARDEAAMDPPF
jgi:hypothetical protein